MMRENFTLDESALILGIEQRHIDWFVRRRILDSYRLSGFSEPRVTKLDLQFFAIVFGFSVSF